MSCESSSSRLMRALYCAQSRYIAILRAIPFSETDQEAAVPEEKFIIEPHFRLQEWVAEEKGYFKDEGLDYIFQELVQKTDGKIHDQGQKVGAYQSLEKGRQANVSCACHWTVNVAASTGKGKLYADVYSVSPSGFFVPPDSPVKHPADLAGV